jgi:hypothetical protein
MVTLQTGSARSLQKFHFRSIDCLFRFQGKLGLLECWNLESGGSPLQVCQASSHRLQLLGR